MIENLKVCKIRHCGLIDNIRDAIYEIDAEGRFVYFNRAAFKLFEYAKQDLKTLHVSDLFVNPDMLDQLNDQLMKFGYVENFETLLKKKNGDKILCILTLFASRNDLSEITDCHGIVCDITPNKRAEDRLKTTQNYTQSIIDSSMDMIIASDQERRIIEFNRAAQETFGYSLEEVIGAPVSILYSDDREGQVVHQNTLCAGPQVLEVLCKRNNGEIFPAFLSSAVLRNNHGTTVGVMGISRDITSEKLKEGELKRMSAAIEQTADSIVITDPKGSIQYVNPTYECLTGYSKEEFIGSGGLAMEIGTKNDESNQEIWETLNKGEIWNGCLINRKKDGTLFEEEATISPVKDDHGKILNYVAIKRDVTEKKRLESIAEATNLMQNLGYIFSGIRHEIGNPVNSVKMALTVLSRNIEKYTRERIAEFVQRAMNEISRVEYLLTALKNMSMYENLKIQKIQINSFMNNFLPLIQEDFNQRGIKINMVLPQKDENAYTDPRAFHQVLLNILTNAADALENSKKPQISIHIKRVKDSLEIKVSDNGCGIPEEEQNNIFKPFFTTKPEGTGLGLMIVRKTLSKMDSAITIKSWKNLGTEVTISMPVKKYFLSQ